MNVKLFFSSVQLLHNGKIVLCGKNDIQNNLKSMRIQSERAVSISKNICIKKHFFLFFFLVLSTQFYVCKSGCSLPWINEMLRQRDEKKIGATLLLALYH